MNAEGPASTRDRRLSRGACKKMTFSEYQDYCLEIHEDPHYPVPTFTGKLSADESSRRERKLADKVVALERQLAEQSLQNKYHVDAQKKFANSNDAKRPGKWQALCWNCLERGHFANQCSPFRTWAERETLRVQKGVPAPDGWEKALHDGGEKDRAKGKATSYLRNQFGRDDEDDGDDLLQSYSVSHSAPKHRYVGPVKKTAKGEGRHCEGTQPSG